MTSSARETVTVGGRTLTLTNLDKVLYPEAGTTKRDVLRYYSEIADVMLPHTRDRPATRKRWVDGVGTAGHPGEMFFQKNLDDSTPDWVARGAIRHKTHTNEYPLVNDLATLTWLGQIATLEIHVPQWRFDRHGRQKDPDRLVLDLDPGEGVGLAECAQVARWIREILTGMDLEAVPVTSGSAGVHVYAALDGTTGSDEIAAVAHELARSLEADHPDLVVSGMSKASRRGRVFIDWSQNNAAKTTIAPYSLRGRSRPTVAAPRTWRELASPALRQLEYGEALRRVARRGDPLAGLAPGRLDAPDDEEGDDPLAVYRDRRDGSRTPEPVPEKAGGATRRRSDGPVFVIQEHHARTLHHDFRLEHDGVLVSWALPKGPPTDPAANRLAVRTEDHPLEYAEFEGTIPKGQYGAGTVRIWDAGRYELEKWRDGEEVIATLDGRPGGGLGGRRRFALIRTGGKGGREHDWLIHLMPDRPPSGRRSAAPPAPMLATLGDASDIVDEDDWAFEMKWDGVRALATVADGAVRLTSRNGNDVTASYPELAALAEAVGDDEVVLDGEIVALDRRGRPDFGVLQRRMGLTRRADVERGVAETPVRLMLFDLLELNGESIASRGYDERRRDLERRVRPHSASPAQVPPAFDGDLAGAIRRSEDLGLEGVMSKERDGRYAAGRRSRTWIKIKHQRTQEVVVGGWRPGKGRRAGTIGSLLVGVPDGDRLRYAGRVGTGFGDDELADLRARLDGRARTRSPLADVPAADARDAHWVRADLVGEVAFAEWTSAGRLRQPSWRGLRPDKAPSDVRRE